MHQHLLSSKRRDLSVSLLRWRPCKWNPWDIAPWTMEPTEGKSSMVYLVEHNLGLHRLHMASWFIYNLKCTKMYKGFKEDRRCFIQKANHRHLALLGGFPATSVALNHCLAAERWDVKIRHDLLSGG